VESYPDSARSYTNRGRLHLEMEDFVESLADYEKSIALEPDNETARNGAEWVSEFVRAEESPFCLAPEVLERYAGQYGPRHVRMRDGRLYYQREGRNEYALIPLDEFTFRLEGLSWFKMRFVAEDEEAPATKIIGLYIDGRRDESIRDE
jgi:hypothetical protein